jgi:hypothetical protein
MNIESLLSQSDPALNVRIPDPSPLDARMISDSSTGSNTQRVRSTHEFANHRGIASKLNDGIRRPATLSVLAVLVAAAILVPLTIGHSNAPRTNTKPGVSTPTQGVWSLAGYISQPGWQASSASGPLPTTQQFTLQLTCPTSATCYSSGTNFQNHEKTQGVISVTHDGGASWRQSLAPGDGTYFYGFSCPTATTCMVVGDVPNTNTHPSLYTTTDGGMTWTSLPMPGFNELPVFLSCATALKCATIGLTQTPTSPTPTSYFTADGGHTWKASVLPPSFFPSANDQPALDCFPNGRCVAAGTSGFGSPLGQTSASMIYSTDDGATWASAAAPPMTATSGLMSCSDDSHCLSIESRNDRNGYQIASGELMTNDGGLTWSAIPTTGLASLSASVPMSFDSITCRTAADCWASTHLIESECSGTCPYVPEQAVMMATSDGGLTWITEQLPVPPSESLQYVSDYPVYCVNATDCRAVGTLELTKSASDAGLPWVQQDVVLTFNGGPVTGVNGTSKS